ncbi:MAG: MFS transporter, partial [Actinobacteria bacterium]|nr:MFS transporter [Actinomycetota bacterium]
MAEAPPQGIQGDERGSESSSGEGAVRYGSPAGRWVIIAAVLGSGVAFLDSTVVNVALPAISEELGGGLAGLQWTIDAYLLTLGSLIIFGGSLGDLYGRKKIFIAGLLAFTLASLICGIAPSIPALIAARALQGIGGALLVPSSLAIISASFHPDDRGQAIGAWSGLSGVSTAFGPFLGGYLVDSV